LPQRIACWKIIQSARSQEAPKLRNDVFLGALFTFKPSQHLTGHDTFSLGTGPLSEIAQRFQFSLIHSAPPSGRFRCRGWLLRSPPLVASAVPAFRACWSELSAFVATLPAHLNTSILLHDVFLFLD
jgi:hypothetical protein